MSLLRAFAALLLLCPALPGLAHEAAAKLTPEHAARELRILERAFRDLHPGLYRYQDEAGLAAVFDQARRDLAGGGTVGDMYLAATRLSASVRCGHTWTNPLNQSPAVQAMLADLPVLPVHLRVLQGRWLVVASADPAIARHDEILAVDGRSVAELTAGLMPYLRADGASDGKRQAQLTHDEQGGALDRLLPLLHPPGPAGHRLRLRAPDGRERELNVAAPRRAARDATLAAAGHGAEDLAWRLEIRGDTAVMTLPTFAFWNSDFDGRAWLREAFAQLDREGVARLVLDLRQNEGGDSALGRALMSHLLDRPYTAPAGRVLSAYERAPYALARFLDTWDFDFFDRTGRVQRGADGAWVVDEAARPPTIKPGAPRFAGPLLALVGPRMSSAGFLLARDLQATGRARLVGEATGGNRRGLNGGELAWLTLPHSGVAVDIPLLATVHAGEPDAPVLPDVPAPATVEDVIAGKDTALEAALALH